jgi:hypothetical protein
VLDRAEPFVRLPDVATEARDFLADLALGPVQFTVTRG